MNHIKLSDTVKDITVSLRYSWFGKEKYDGENKDRQKEKVSVEASGKQRDLTPDEARELARVLEHYADMAENEVAKKISNTADELIA
jgi:hypothetical protein